MAHVASFEGPMDLLLELIRKREMDIYNIEIHTIVEDYLGYLNGALDPSMESLSDFIYFASYLLAIKSRMLLPKPPTLEREEEEDPRKELVDALLIYQMVKEAVGILKERGEEEEKAVYRLQEDYSPPSPLEQLKDIEAESLRDAFVRIMKRHALHEAAREELGRIPQNPFTFAQGMEKMRLVFGQRRSVLFSELLASSTSNDEILTLFLIVLEEMKQQRLEAEQDHLFSDIRLTRRSA
ncbi:MAG: segregation/condensation protein A [Tissierellia bacterium]|nr:segregation/condensation protein A [Tissierellia bacterium]